MYCEHKNIGDQVAVAYFKCKYMYLGNSNTETEYNHKKSRAESPVSQWILELGIYRTSNITMETIMRLFVFDIISRTLKLKQYHIFRSEILLKIFKTRNTKYCANCDFPSGYVTSMSTNRHLVAYNFSGTSSGI